MSRDGEIAVAAAEGLFVGKGELQRVLPRDGNRSWAVVDARGVAYDSAGRLWFASPQGAAVRESGAWRLLTGLEGLPEDDFTTVAAGEPGIVWFGTHRGAIRFDGKTWEYRQGLRWLPARRRPRHRGDAPAATPGSPPTRARASSSASR